VSEAEVRAAIPALRASCGDRAVLRAFHFYADDRAAQAEAEALRRGLLRFSTVNCQFPALWEESI